MATWTAPTTRASGALITASIWNTDLVENLKYLKDAPVIDTAVIIGAATTSGIRLDLESGTLAVREGDDSAYGPISTGALTVSTGRVLVGTTTARTLTTLDSLVQIETAGSTYQQLSLISNRNDTGGASLILGKSRGTAVGGVTVVNDGDNLGFIRFQAADGVDMDSIAAQILAQVDGAPGSNDTPGRLIFSTAADGAASVTERMRITSTGTVQPGANDGGALGTGSLAWSDLFLASGGVINFANGDVTLTHGSNTLTFAGAASGYNFNDGQVIVTKGTTSEDKVFISGTGGAANNYVGLLLHQSGTNTAPLYSGGMRLIMTASSPSFLDPALTFVVQASGTSAAASVTERARITSGGTFCVNTTGPVDGELIRVVSGSSGKYAVRFENSHASNPNGVFVVYGSSPNGAGNEFVYCTDSTTLRASIRSNGGLANYSANNANLSDARTKRDIKPAASYWDKIKAIEIVTFKYNDQTHDDDNIGVISQQVEAVAPEFVDVDGFGETPADGVPLKSIYTTDLYHAAIKALQEAMARIEALEARLN